MTAPSTKTLRVSLVDLELVPAGPGGTVSGWVWVKLTKQVRTVDGQIVVLADVRKVVDSTGEVDFEVPANDDAGIMADDQGFGVTVGWNLTSRGARGSTVTVTNAGTTVLVTSADPSVTLFAAKAAAVPADALSSYSTEAQVDGKIATLGSIYAPTLGPRPYYLDAYNAFFGGASGASPDARWLNTSHLTTAGYTAFAAWIVDARKPDGSYVITNPGTKPIVLLGDSWIDSNTAYATAIHARIPSATIVNVGVAGDTSTAMLTRFAADVPADAAYVIINEPGVNDIYQEFNALTIASNLEALIAMIRALGATPVITGMVPLVDHPGASARRSAQMIAQFATSPSYPALGARDVLKILLPSPTNTSLGALAQTALTTGDNNTGIGDQSQRVLTTGTSNTGVGQNSQQALTTGNNNTAIGQATQTLLTTGNNNTAIGQGTQNAITDGTNNIAVGQHAQLSLTAGGEDIGIGNGSQYSPKGVVGNATTLGNYQTCLGNGTGQSGATQVSGITCVGYNATAGGNYGLALGHGTTTDEWTHGAVAIGTDDTGAGAHATAINDFVLGTALHRYKMPGLPTANPGAGSGILWNNAGVVTVA